MPLLTHKASLNTAFPRHVPHTQHTPFPMSVVIECSPRTPIPIPSHSEVIAPTSITKKAQVEKRDPTI